MITAKVHPRPVLIQNPATFGALRAKRDLAAGLQALIRLDRTRSNELIYVFVGRNLILNIASVVAGRADRALETHWSLSYEGPGEAV